MSVFVAAAVPYFREAGKAIRADSLVYGLVAIYLLAGSVYVLGCHGALFSDFDVYAVGCLAACVVVLPYGVLVAGVARILLRLKRRRRLAFRAMFAPRRIARLVAGTLLTLLILLPFEEMFTSIKSAFSNAGFGYDKAVADFDKFIHFGHAPVKYLLAVVQNESLLRTLEFNYHEIWVLVWLGMLYWVAVSPRAESLRLRYCLTFCLVWILVGNVVAGLLPTAGPAFYGLVTGDDDRFAKLHDFLLGDGNGISLTASTQQYLWSLHRNGTSGFGSGISALPSMHVAIITMNALFLAERGRLWAVAGTLYTVVIMLSSVYLGWHYAVDGYVAVLMSVLIYWAVRRTVPAFATLSPIRRAGRRQGAGTVTTHLRPAP